MKINIYTIHGIKLIFAWRKSEQSREHCDGAGNLLFAMVVQLTGAIGLKVNGHSLGHKRQESEQVQPGALAGQQFAQRLHEPRPGIFSPRDETFDKGRKKYFTDYIVHAESLTWNRAARYEEICTFRNFVTSFHRVSVSLSRTSVLVLALACLNILFY